LNILFLSQSRTLKVFCGLATLLAEKNRLNRAGFVISDSEFYGAFQGQAEAAILEKALKVKQWEINRRATHHRPNIEALREYERKYGDPVLWNAIVADRRIYMGKRATVEQDYGRRYSEDRMLSIMELTIGELETLYEKLKPDVVVGFICVTIGEYLAYLMAKKKGIKFINLRPTRIENYIYGAETVTEPSSHLKQVYERFYREPIPEGLAAQARKYLDRVIDTHAMYEGVVPVDGVKKEGGRSIIRRLRGWVTTFRREFKRFFTYHFTVLRNDDHYNGSFYKLWFEYAKKPVRRVLMDLCLRNRYISEEDLERYDFAFYPLHKEPEVTLLVYSRPYLNQVEVIRNIARSLPVGMRLVVKEHPAAIGYRKTSYYKKLLRIPNVYMVPPETRSRSLVRASRFVAVISGSVALEAVVLGKPVLVFGRVPFEFLPRQMLRKIVDLDSLAEEICDLLLNYKYDQRAILSYISAVMESSVKVDFYSRLLERQGVYNVGGAMDERDQINSLAEYIVKISMHTTRAVA